MDDSFLKTLYYVKTVQHSETKNSFTIPKQGMFSIVQESRVRSTDLGTVMLLVFSCEEGWREAVTLQEVKCSSVGVSSQQRCLWLKKVAPEVQWQRS